MAAIPSVELEMHHDELPTEPAHKPSALTPPTSEDLDKRDDASSELSELELEEDRNLDEEDDDIGDIEPGYYYEDGKIPVFTPTMEQFKDFKKFVEKIDKYGMKSGIVKVIPPKEWRDSLPTLEEAVKTIKVKNPIMQEFVGTHGTYTQQNIEKQRSYNLPQWRALTNESNHQPPAKRGERRRNVDPPKPKAPRSQNSTPILDGEKRRPGRPRKHPLRKQDPTDHTAAESSKDPQVPPTPTSPEEKNGDTDKEIKNEDADDAEEEKAEESPVKSRKPGRPRKSSPKPRGRQPKATTVAERRKYNQTVAADEIDEESFKDFDYRYPQASEFTQERCHQLEEVYWKTLNYGTPMYGADMPGSLFGDSTNSWHVGRLENLLDVLGTKIPGVNTTYLYLGMWKATFAWHLEDVDLYSINYIHFGAPKQWYSISQEDARRFEAAMKSIWPTDAKHCDQFLRHKTYLISPEKLKSQFNIKVNKLVHHEGEFVITYPYGYHSGFNLGYNCAESVNFATEAWLNYGRIAKKCNCEADSVWVDVAEIERKLRGEPTPEYYEETDDEEDETSLLMDRLPSPPASVAGKKKAGRKRKRDVDAKEAGRKKTKRIKILVKAPNKMPCVLCPNDVVFDKLLPTDTGAKAHRLCALYTPETYVSEVNGQEIVRNVAGIDKSRLDLKCIFCRSKRGACFQCAERKCTRAFHATCATAAGVLVDTGPVPTWDEDGTEFYCEGFDFRCRFHRPRRPKIADGEYLEKLKLVKEFAKGLKKNDTIQAQYFGADAFGGVVIENRPEEQTVLVEVLPDGDQVEVEWKYILVLDPAESKRPKPSPDAKPLPEVLHHNASVNVNNRKDGVPDMGDIFHTNEAQKWAEWNALSNREVRNTFQEKIDISKPERLWYYLGKASTEAKAKYTHDPEKSFHNPNSVFLDTVKPPPKSTVIPDRRSFPASYPSGVNFHALNGAMVSQRQQIHPQQIKMDRPYMYKPKSAISSILNPQSPVSPQTP
ncbi:JmjC-domain-containing protein, partial [Rhizodiscina lignyota]